MMEMVLDSEVIREEKLLNELLDVVEEIEDNERLKLKGIKFYGFRSLEKCPLIVELLWRMDKRGGLLCLLKGAELKKGFKQFLEGLEKEDVDVKVEISEKEVVIVYEEGVGESYKRGAISFERIK